MKTSASVQRGKYSASFAPLMSLPAVVFVYDPSMIGYCPASLRLTPRLLKRIFGRITQDQWNQPTGPDRFSPNEVIQHMTFWEPVARWRAEQALIKDGVDVPDWDEDQHAKDFNYSELDPIDALDRFASEREKTMSLFDSLKLEDWQRRFTHPVKGTLTIYAWAATMLGHDLYHLAQLDDLAE